VELPMQYPCHLGNCVVIDRQDVGDLLHNLRETECATILAICQRLCAI
jgi:hypothetical protein